MVKYIIECYIHISCISFALIRVIFYHETGDVLPQALYHFLY